jgi:ATP-binding cassette subfamily B protein
MEALRKLVWPALRSAPAAWLAVAGLTFAQAVFHLATPAFYALVFDHVIIGGDLEFLWRLLGALTVVFALMVAAEWQQARLLAGTAQQALGRLRLALYEHLQRLPVSYFGRTKTGDLVARFTADLAAVDRALATSLYKVGLNAIVAALCTGALFLLEWRLALFTLAVLPFASVLPRLLARRAEAAGYEKRKDEGRLSNAAQEAIAGFRMLRAFSLEHHLTDRFRMLLGQARHSGTRANWLGALVEKTANLGVILAQLAIVALGAALVVSGSLTPGGLAGFLGLLFNASGGILALTAFVPDLFQANAGARRILEVLEEPAPDYDASQPTGSARAVSGEIRFENVSFRYDQNPVLDRVNFTVAAGESVAVVGRSGSGKSTLLSLLLRFHEPSEGRITVDGTDIRALPVSELRGMMACVFQNTFLFDASVAENIRYGRLDASHAEIERAARAAQIHDAIAMLPEGYDTPLGELGGRLSGGQQQRLAIARAVIRDPAILLLDEATSALDPQTEAAVNLTLRNISRGRTCIAVTHRLAVAASLDRCLVLDRGRLVEAGTHEELLSRGGVYFDLWQKQSAFAVSPAGTTARLDARFLRTMPIFAILDDARLERFAVKFESECYEAGAIVLRRGDVGESLYVVVRGRLAVEGNEQVDRTAPWMLEQGDFFGEIALLTNRARTATVRALERCLLLTLSRQHFDEVLDQTPGLRAAFEEVAKARLDALAAARS